MVADELALRRSDSVGHTLSAEDLETSCTFRDIKINYCILDEGHVIKNGKTKLSKAIKQLAANFQVILSGTPIQNDVRFLAITSSLSVWSVTESISDPFFNIGLQKWPTDGDRNQLTTRIQVQFQGTLQLYSPTPK